jgi:hypothetical protein
MAVPQGNCSAVAGLRPKNWGLFFDEIKIIFSSFFKDFLFIM